VLEALPMVCDLTTILVVLIDEREERWREKGSVMEKKEKKREKG